MVLKLFKLQATRQSNCSPKVRPVKFAMAYHKVQYQDNYFFNFILRLITNLHSKIHRFNDDTNFLCVFKKIDQTINFGHFNLVQWLRSSKIFLGRNKSGLVTFRSPKKQIYKNLNFRLSGQKSNQNVTHSSQESFNEYMSTLKKIIQQMVFQLN